VRTPFRKILCPTDLSPIGNSALRVAYAIADAGTTVHVLYVFAPVELAALAAQGRWAPTVIPTPEERRADEERMRARLQRLVPAESVEEGVRTEIHIDHGFPVAERIEAAARAHDVDVVVMGTHGRTGVGRVLLGSVAAEVMRRKGISVLLVHDDRVVHPVTPGASERPTRALP
jgi:nucleotide-binding universal stress UspA family protein